MRINSINHRNENNGLFGLLPMFLVYQAKTIEKASGSESVEEKARREEVASKKEIKEAEKKFEAFKKKLGKEIDKYNKKHTSKEHSWNEPYKRPLLTDVSNFGKLVDQIDDILTRPFMFEGEHYTLRDFDYVEQRKELLKIRSMLTSSTEVVYGGRRIFIDKVFIRTQWNDYVGQRPDLRVPVGFAPLQNKFDNIAANQLHAILAKMNVVLQHGQPSSISESDYIELLEARAAVQLQIDLLGATSAGSTVESQLKDLETAKENPAIASGRIIVTRMGEALAHAEEKTKIQKKPAYKELSDMYDYATVTPVISAGSDQFKNFWTNPEYGLSSSDRDESKNLFFSLLRRDTDSFDDKFVLGKKFGEDADKNRENFPLIYNEWLESKSIKAEEMQVFNREVDGIRNEMSAEAPFPSVKNLTESANAIPYQIALDIQKFNSVPVPPAITNKQRFDKLGSVVNHYIHQLNDKMSSDDKLNNDAALEKVKAQFELWKRLLGAQYNREKQVAKKMDIKERFTRSSLKDSPQLVMELAMRKFHKAMTMVDNPLPHGNWKPSYNPAVRRILIANIYDEGVSDFRIDFGTGKEVYIDNLAVDNNWMLTVLARSPHYSMQEKSDRMDEKKRRLLPVLQLANEVHVDLKNYKTANSALDAVMKWKNAGSNENDQSTLSEFPKGMIALFKEQNVNALSAKLDQFKQEEKDSKKFLKEVKIAIKNPDSKEAQTLIDAIRNGDYSGIIKPEMLAGYEQNMKQVELNYNMLSLDDKSRMDFMERLGISTVGVYEAYTAALNAKPEAERYTYSVDNWDRLRASPDPADFKKLMFMLENSMGSSDKEGKKHFLNVFRAMHMEGSADLAGMEDSKVHVMGIYEMIKKEARDSEIGRAKIASGEAEYLAKIEGETVGDKATRYIKGAVNMLMGPGQSWANRGAGLILMIAALKAAHSAYKGETKAGKALRLLFVAGAAELATKEVTGRGILERLGFETLMEAGEGTSEAVLVMDGVDHMDDKMVGPEEHTRALYELRKIPFHEAMAWYMDTNTNKEDGMPISGEDDKFPSGIDVDNIVFGEKWKAYEPEHAGRRVVMQTMKHFFEYSGRKDHESPRMSALSLNERWATSMEDGFDANNLKYSKFAIPPAALALYKANRDKLTWGVVIDAEIDQQARNETVGKHGAQPILDFWAEKGSEFVEWGRLNLKDPASKYAQELERIFGKNADKVGKFGAELASKINTKVHFGAESMKLKLEDHELEIRNFFGSNVELIWEGVKFFPSTLIGINQWGVPKLLTALKQGKEILFEDQIPQISGEVLSARDMIEGDEILMLDNDFRKDVRNLIRRRGSANLSEAAAREQVKETWITSNNPQFAADLQAFRNANPNLDAEQAKKQVIESWMEEGKSAKLEAARLRALDDVNAYMPKNNPSFKHFGYYQKPFMKAMEAGGRDPKKPTTDTAGKYIKTPEKMFHKSGDGVGYFITETTQDDSNIMEYGEHDVRSRYSKMAVKAREQAEAYFIGQGYNITREELEDMMNPIHVAVKSSEYPPQVRYTFWRMPLPGSKEYELKTSDHWADTMDANRHKYRHPFYVDPGKGTFGNFKEAYGVDSPAARKAISAGFKIIGRVGGAAMGTSERLGEMGDWVTNIFIPANEPQSDFLERMASWEDPNKQLFDEVTGVAGETGSARSDFYSDRAHPERATMFMALRDLAIITGNSYYYGVIPDRMRTGWDNPRPADWTDAKWEEYYTDWCFDHGYNEDGTLIRGQVAGARARRVKKGRKGKGKGKGKGKKK